MAAGATLANLVEVEHWYRRRTDIERSNKDAKHGAALRHLPSGDRTVNTTDLGQKDHEPDLPLSYYAPTMSEPDLAIEPCDICGGPVEIVTVGHHAMGDMTETTESREPEITYQCTVDKSHRLAPRS